jgi:hypothetical protein
MVEEWVVEKSGPIWREVWEIEMKGSKRVTFQPPNE